MGRYRHHHAIGLGLSLWAFLGGSAIAVPGNSAAAVEAWINAHPTLRPGPTERLVVNRAETPARRFRFRATVIPVTGISPDLVLGRLIRTEEASLVDIVDGITANRMEEALRVIYDATIYNDYRRAAVVYRYSNAATVVGTSGVLRQGELRQGDRFAYWWELTGNPEGFTTMGKMTVFLIEDLPPLQERLQSTFETGIAE